MHISKGLAHLTYCTNIHPGESWDATFRNIREHTLTIKERLNAPAFGIGLRLSDEAARALIHPETLKAFKEWLTEHDCYVFAINGFPFGSFHHQVVKDEVHTPDWTTSDRREYTMRLLDILATLLPEGMEGGVTTSPLSYRFWHQTSAQLEAVSKQAAQNIAEVLLHLVHLEQETGKWLHLDLEPEPDGVLETSDECIAFFQEVLLPEASRLMISRLGCSQEEAAGLVQRHFQICYDVCHFAVGFEKPSEVIHKFADAGLKIGRIQISAALSSGWLKGDAEKAGGMQALAVFDEPTYLHQAVLRDQDGRLTRFRDLQPALHAWPSLGPGEMRTHFHVPVFTTNYGALISTQQDIIEVLKLWQQAPFCRHLEVETYTWDVLPADLRQNLDTSITRELSWVMERLKDA